MPRVAYTSYAMGPSQYSLLSLILILIFLPSDRPVARCVQVTSPRRPWTLPE